MWYPLIEFLGGAASGRRRPRFCPSVSLRLYMLTQGVLAVGKVPNFLY